MAIALGEVPRLTFWKRARRVSRRMTGAPEVVVGIDLGTSSTKVLATTADGDVVASASRRYSLDTPRPDCVELDARDVECAAKEALHEVLREVASRSGRVRAVGFSCAMHGIVPIDARGEAIGPLVTWMDRRSAEIAERWRRDGTAQTLYRRTGAPVHPMLPSCKLRWFAEHDPSYVQRAAKFVSLKELIVQRWTGEWLVDYGLASGTGLFDVRRRVWDSAALAAAGIDAAKLSTLCSTTETRALVPRIARELGLPFDAVVVLGSSDGALANLGVGATGPGDVALTLGTSGALRIVVDEPHFDDLARTFCYAYDDRRFIVGGATSSAGAVLRERLAAPRSLRLSGALARDPFVRQLIADVFGCESVLGNHDEASAFGAAMLAAIAIGLVADDRSVAALLHPVHQHRPSPGAFDRYGLLYERYAAAVAAAIQQFGTVP